MTRARFARRAATLVLPLAAQAAHAQWGGSAVLATDDRFRGIHGTRQVVFMSQEDIQRHGLRAGDRVVLLTVAEDFVREVPNLEVVPYAIPTGCAAAYYPECNALVPLWHHAVGSKVPASKSVPVRIRKMSLD